MYLLVEFWSLYEPENSDEKKNEKIVDDELQGTRF